MIAMKLTLGGCRSRISPEWARAEARSYWLRVTNIAREALAVTPKYAEVGLHVGHFCHGDLPGLSIVFDSGSGSKPRIRVIASDSPEPGEPSCTFTATGDVSALAKVMRSCGASFSTCEIEHLGWVGALALSFAISESERGSWLLGLYHVDAEEARSFRRAVFWGALGEVLRRPPDWAPSEGQWDLFFGGATKEIPHESPAASWNRWVEESPFRAPCFSATTTMTEGM